MKATRLRSRWESVLSVVGIVALAACGDDGGAPVDAGVLDAIVSADAASGDAAREGGVDASVCRARVAAGAPCAVISDCDDGCYCNGAERCEGVCVAGPAPCTDPHACTTDSCDESARACSHVPDAARCGDDDACNGVERCDPERGCEPGAPPVCDDGDDCTVDTCDAVLGCLSEPRDRDGDGFGDGLCGGLDCLDDPARGGASVAPGRAEICDNGLDDDCDGITDDETPACTPRNDDCATARVLPASGTYVGATRGLAVDYTVECASRVAPGSYFDAAADAVFRFTLTEPSDVLVAARALVVSSFNSTAVVLRRWDDCETGPELRPIVCDPGDRVRARSLPAGDYAVIVATSEATTYSLALDITPATTPPPIDVCGPDMLEIGGGGTFSAYRSDVLDDYATPCSGTRIGALPDAVYRLTLDAPKDVRISLRGAGVLALLRDCADPTRAIVCEPFSAAYEPVITRRALPAGTYFVLVEPVGSGMIRVGSDALVLDVQVHDPEVPPRGDSCGTAIPLVPGVAETVSLAPLASDVGVTCASERSPIARDAVYVFTTTDTQDVTFTLDAPDARGSLDLPVLALSARCEAPTEARTCTVSENPALITRTWRSLPPGTWYLVFATGLREGTLTARISLSPPTPVPANDLCADALPLVSGRAETFIPARYSNDTSLSCDFGGGNDAFYTFTLTEPQQVDLIAIASDGSSVAMLVQRVCADPAPLACAFASPAAFSGALEAGTYSVVVDAASAIPSVRLTPFFTPL